MNIDKLSLHPRIVQPAFVHNEIFKDHYACHWHNHSSETVARFVSTSSLVKTGLTFAVLTGMTLEKAVTDVEWETKAATQPEVIAAPGDTVRIELS